MKELNNKIWKLELELKLLHSSKAALLRERRRKKISKEDYEFLKNAKQDEIVKEAYRRTLEKKLIEARREGKAIQLALTGSGEDAARLVAQDPQYDQLLEHMKSVAREFKNKTGNALKNLIYEAFDAEVGDLPWGETIQP